MESIKRDLGDCGSSHDQREVSMDDRIHWRGNGQASTGRNRIWISEWTDVNLPERPTTGAAVDWSDARKIE